MREFKELMKEAFAGAEPFDAHPGREELARAVSRFERRDLTVRWLAWTAVLLASVGGAWAVYAFVHTPETNTKSLLLYTAAFLFAMAAIGWMKTFLIVMQNHLTVMKELKRVQMLISETMESRGD